MTPTESALGATGAIVALILAVLGIILAVMWIVLPVILVSKLNKLIALQEQANQYLYVTQYGQTKQMREASGPEQPA